MDLEQLKREWVGKSFDLAAETAAWDGAADEYVYEAKNNFEDDPFLRFVASKVGLDRSMRTLDIGCGAGGFSVAMAQRVGQADGSDLLPRMIEVGKRYLQQAGIQNVNLWVDDWRAADMGRYERAYDLVFAHTTPAVNDFVTLEKMCRASRRHCFSCITARRVDHVYDEVKRIAGRGFKPYDEQVSQTFQALWYMGYNPQVDYGTITWLPLKSFDEASAWFLGRLRMSGPVDAGTEQAVLDYLKSICKDGMVQERIDTTLVNMYWTVG